MSTLRLGLAIGLSAFMVGSAPASFGPQQTPSPLQEVAALLLGTWTGEGVYAADYPGVGRKGDTFTSRHTCDWVAGEAALRCEGNFGPAAFTDLYWWDAASREVRTVGINSGGNWAEGTISKQGAKLVWSSAGSLSDGRKVEYRGETTFQDNGNAYVAAGATILGGVASEFSDVYKRAGR